MAEVSQDWMEMGELGILRQPWHREQPLWAPQEQGLHTWPLAGDYGYGTVWVSHALLPFMGKGASINSLPASEPPTDPLQLWGAAENTEIQNEHPLMCWQQDLPGFCHRNTCAGSPKDVSSLLHSCFPSNTISWPISTFSECHWPPNSSSIKSQQSFCAAERDLEFISHFEYLNQPCESNEAEVFVLMSS